MTTRIAIPIAGALALACGEVDEGRAPDDAGGKFRANANATVAWTNGEGLNVRESATPSSTRVDWLAEGAQVTIVCQVEGAAVDGTAVWDRLEAPAGYVLDAYMKTGYASWIPGVPKCGASDEGCGDVDYQGYCDGDRLVWCEDDALHEVDCGSAGRECAWQSANVGWNCLDESGGGGAGEDIVVAGWTVTAQERHWLEYIGREVVPRLSGSRSSRLTTAARVAWWTLKEGVLGLDYAFEYSNCNFPSGDAHIGPVDGCPVGRAWQVGLAASQVPWPYVDVDATALALHPGMSIEDVLWWTASEAGHDPSATDVGAAIVASTGDLRTSWLLRNPAVGFTNEVEVVTAECIEDSLSWCFGTGWDTTARYAPDRATAMAAIDDLYAAFDRLAP